MPEATPNKPPGTGSVRRLTFDGGDGWITPEFTWDPKGRELWFTQNRLPPGARVAMPLDPVKELTEAKDFLEHPPSPDAGTLGKAAALDIVLPVEQRTKVLRFKLPAKAKSGKSRKRMAREGRLKRRTRRSRSAQRRSRPAPRRAAARR
jgi:hypothetical protein